MKENNSSGSASVSSEWLTTGDSVSLMPVLRIEIQCSRLGQLASLASCEWTIYTMFKYCIISNDSLLGRQNIQFNRKASI